MAVTYGVAQEATEPAPLWRFGFDQGVQRAVEELAAKDAAVFPEDSKSRPLRFDQDVQRVAATMAATYGVLQP
jgi:hypothetical protein